MAKVFCQNCGAEVILPEKSEIAVGMTISKESNGNYVIPTEKKENKTMSNFSNEMNKENNIMNFDMNELVAEVAKRINGNTTTVNKTVDVSVPMDKNHWAMNSKYYGKDICGYVFNPYMWRYWTVKQYMEMYNTYDSWTPHNVSRKISERYDYLYAIDYTIKEINKLAMLEKRDPIAFEERKLTFRFNDCLAIILGWLKDMQNGINAEISKQVAEKRVGSEIYIKYGDEWRSVGTVKEGVNEYHKVEKGIEFSDEYHHIARNISEDIYAVDKVHLRYWNRNNRVFRDLADAVNKVKKCDAKYVKHNKLPREFKDAFIRTGAYYSMKTMIAFDGKQFRGLVGRDAIKELRNELVKGLDGYCYHAMLKEMLGDR